MKKILTLSVLVIAGIFFASCKENSVSNFGEMPMKTGTNTSTTAHPALAYIGSGTLHGAFAETIAVMDTDGANQTNIYTAGTSGSLVLTAGGNRPSWSAAGDKICFAERTSTPYQVLLRKIDVTVSNGKPVGSNAATLYTINASDSLVCYSEAFSSTTTTAKIAFGVSRGSNASTQYAKLYSMPATGGTPTLLYQSQDDNHHEFTEITWSPDDAHIAFIDKKIVGNTAAHNSMIRIIDATTGAMTDSLSPDYFLINSLEWSRTGSNKLAFCTQDTDVGPSGTDFGMKLRYVDPTTGSTPTTDGVVVKYPSWSPNNSAILASPVIVGDNTLKKVQAFTSTVNNITNTPSVSNIRIRWKR